MAGATTRRQIRGDSAQHRSRHRDPVGQHGALRISDIRILFPHQIQALAPRDCAEAPEILSCVVAPPMDACRAVEQGR